MFARCVYVCCDYVCCVCVGRVPKSDRTTVHKNLIVALGVAQLLLMCSEWASAHQVTLLLFNYYIVYNIVVVLDIIEYFDVLYTDKYLMYYPPDRSFIGT